MCTPKDERDLPAPAVSLETMAKEGGLKYLLEARQDDGG